MKEFRMLRFCGIAVLVLTAGGFGMDVYNYFVKSQHVQGTEYLYCIPLIIVAILLVCKRPVRTVLNVYNIFFTLPSIYMLYVAYRAVSGDFTLYSEPTTNVNPFALAMVSIVHAIANLLGRLFCPLIACWQIIHTIASFNFVNEHEGGPFCIVAGVLGTLITFSFSTELAVFYILYIGLSFLHYEMIHPSVLSDENA